VAAERAERLKAWTICSHLAVLSALFAFARDDLDMRVSMPQLKPSERPGPADDAREPRILTDDELARVLDACGQGERLYFRTLADTGGANGRSPRPHTSAHRLRHGQLRRAVARGGELAPLKTRTSRRTIEVTRSLAAALALQGERVFGT
jgi:integrase